MYNSEKRKEKAMNNNSRRKKIDKQNLLVATVVILMMIAVVVAIAVSLAKSRSIIEEALEGNGDETEKLLSSDIFPDETKDAVTLSPETEDVFMNDGSAETHPSDTGKVPSDTTPSPDTEKSDAADTLPKFSAPVSGEIIKHASIEAPVFSLTMEDYRTHPGVDIYCPTGEDIAAVADGTVKEIWDDPMMGMCISVEHSGGAVSVYKGVCDEIPPDIAVGKTVFRGQTIATSGDTALLEIAEESHLHFELSVNGKTVDPCDYITFPTSPVFTD